MRQHIERLIQIALKQLQETEVLPAIPAFVQVEPTKDKQFGDFASNIALILAKTAKISPRDLAQRIIQAIPASPYVKKIEMAGPGFINFFLSVQAFNDVVARILSERDQYGRSKMGRNKKVLVEFLSSNPTGPLHVGHGRHGAYGAVICSLLEAVGFNVSREYYVNDAGRQMDILTASIWVRYLNRCGEEIPFPANGYKGDYVFSIADLIYEQHQKEFCHSAKEVLADLPPDEAESGDKEVYVDALIERAKQLLGNKYEIILDLGLNYILKDIFNDLSDFGVYYEKWFSERHLVVNKLVDQLLDRLKASGHTYERDGALWFRSTDFGDEKDRVLVRSNGQRTYFANDAAYHLNKFERDYDIVIDIFGSDHHGYFPRMKAVMEALGINPERLIHLLVQFVTLYRGKEQVAMSTRGGNFVTLRELREEVGNDAARFFYIMRKADQHVDFDLELAKSRSNENPVYYVQYAYARICSVFKQLQEKKLRYDEANGIAHLDLLIEPEERQLLNTLARYPDIIIDAALQYEPHLLINYLRDLAADFHSYYNSHQFLVEDPALCDARLALISAVRQTLLNGFNLIGIKAPETM